MENKALFLKEIEDRLKNFFGDDDESSEKQKASGTELLQKSEANKEDVLKTPHKPFTDNVEITPQPPLVVKESPAISVERAETPLESSIIEKDLFKNLDLSLDKADEVKPIPKVVESRTPPPLREKFEMPSKTSDFEKDLFRNLDAATSDTKAGLFDNIAQVKSPAETRIAMVSDAFGELEKMPTSSIGAEKGKDIFGDLGSAETKADKASDVFGELDEISLSESGSSLEDLYERDSVQYSPLKDLQSVVLTIEWEIDDQILQNYDEQVNRLTEIYKDDKIVLGLLLIMRFLGRYIKIESSSTDPDAIKLLLRCYDDLETLVLTHRMGDTARTKILGDNARKYRDLLVKLGIDTGQEIQVEEEEFEETELEEVYETKVEVAESKVVIAEPVVMVSQVAAPFSLDDIKSVIQAEFCAVVREKTIPDAVVFPLDEIKNIIQTELSSYIGSGATPVAFDFSLEDIKSVIHEELSSRGIEKVPEEAVVFPIDEIKSIIQEELRSDISSRTATVALNFSLEDIKSVIREELGGRGGEKAPHEAFVFALGEIKSTIQAEFRSLRAELKLWREG